MASTSRHSSGGQRRPWLTEVVAPLVPGLALVVFAAIVGASQDWSPGAFWAAAFAAAMVSFSCFAVRDARRAPRLRTRTPATPHPVVAADPPALDRQEVAIGIAIGPRPVYTGVVSPLRVVAITGRSGSGKSRIADRLAKDFPDWALVKCGDYVRARAAEAGIEPRLPATHDFGQQLIERLGGASFLEEVLSSANVPASAQGLIVDDVYHVAVYEALAERFPHMTFCKVELPESLRRQFLESQGLDEEEVDEIEASPLDHAVEDLTALYPPAREIPGATNDDEVTERSHVLGGLLAAA